MTDEDDDFMLNIHIARDLPNRSVTLSQEHVITELCSSVDLSDIPFTATPILTTTATSADCPVLNSEEWHVMQKHPYSSIVGSLVSISRQTRPDISYAVSVVGRFVKNPGLAHWHILRRILKYLSATASFGLTLGLSPHSSFKTRHLDLTLEPSQHDLVGYVDADWGGCADTAKSTTGFGFYLYGGLITWRSKLQNTVSSSSTYSEYIASYEAMAECLWIRNFLSELNLLPHPTTPILCDNLPSIHIGKHHNITPRNKHFHTKFHSLKEHIDNQSIEFFHIPTTTNIADGWTKPLSKPSFQQFCTSLNLIPYPSYLHVST
jgi:hypothetical protein